MLGVFIIPTGLGAKIGGHAGDASPAAKLIASCCDRLIVHPNVVNASDINEMTENMLYVDGFLLDHFLNGVIRLKEARQNRILLVANAPLAPSTMNAVNAARVTIGADIEVVKLKTPLKMVAGERIDGKQQSGVVSGVNELVDQVKQISCDAIAIHTPIEVHRSVALDYYRNGGVNPWGGVEAVVSRAISLALLKPVAHAPLETVTKDDDELYNFNEVVDPRIAPEQISSSYLHCVLKGLHRAPGIGGLSGILASDVDFMVSPMCKEGRPHKACNGLGIPIIYVRENTVAADQIERGDVVKGIVVDNYLEAAGVVMAMQAGVTRASVSIDKNAELLRIAQESCPLSA